MSSIRGRGRSLEIAVDRVLAEAREELRQALGERPDFYRGSRAVANLGSLEPPASEIVSFRELLAGFGITLDGTAQDPLADITPPDGKSIHLQSLSNSFLVIMQAVFLSAISFFSLSESLPTEAVFMRSNVATLTILSSPNRLRRFFAS